MALVRFLHAVKRGIVGFHCFDPKMGQGGCGILVPLSSVVCHHVDHYGFASFILGCTFDSAFAYLTYRRSAETHWSSVDGVSGWFPYGFTEGSGHDLVDATVPSWKGEASGAVGAYSLYTARSIVCMVPSADRCRLPSAIACMRPPS